MDRSHNVASVLLFESGSDPAALQLLLLGLAFVSLVGPMAMPGLLYSARYLPFLVGVTLRRLGDLIIDRLIESVIVAVLAIAGGLWILDFFPTICR